MDLEFTVNNQTLKRTDSEKPADYFYKVKED